MYANKTSFLGIGAKSIETKKKGQGPMKKVVFSVIAALAVSAAVPAFAADMPVKAMKAPAPAVSPWDIAFGTAFTTDYRLRGISQSNKKPAVQGYFELDYTATEWLKLYAGIWGSSMYAGFADAEFDFSGGARLSYGNAGLDLGYVYYSYPDGVSAGVAAGGAGNGSFGDFYAKPSYKFNDWLTVGGVIDYGTNNNNGIGIVGSKVDGFYAANAVITLPIPLPYGIGVSLNPEIGRQFVRCTGCDNSNFTYYDVGLDFTYKAMTLDLRYWDTSKHGVNLSPVAYGAKDLGGSTFVATLKFDTTLAALK
jgi:uncharacterized protein (TIGR02001 family)